MLGFRITTFALLAGAVVAQNLPPCANDCVGGENYNNCNKFDVGCICNSADWIAGLACCVSKNCSGQDQADTIKFANKICAGAGVTTLPQTATCASTAASVASASSGSATSSTVIASTASVAPATTSAATTTTNPSATAAQQTTSSRTGAANAHSVAGAGVGAVIAGLAMFL